MLSAFHGSVGTAKGGLPGYCTLTVDPITGNREWIPLTAAGGSARGRRRSAHLDGRARLPRSVLRLSILVTHTLGIRSHYLW